MTREASLGAIGYLADIRVLPAQMRVSARRWLNNFHDGEIEFATALLDSFVYFANDSVDRLFESAFDSLAPGVTRASGDFSGKCALWERFRDTVVVTHPTGESPNVTDSGYAFDRKARQLLHVPEQHIVEPSEVVRLLNGGWRGSVLFVDDFVGSGDQFVKSWNRRYFFNATHHSIADFASEPGMSFHYIPFVCTAAGFDVVHNQCPEVQVKPAHLLPEEYSARHSNSLLFPDHLRATSGSFIETASLRAGIPIVETWGYKGLGLALAFEHSTPDATLPLLHWEGNGWIPLVSRR